MNRVVKKFFCGEQKNWETLKSQTSFIWQNVTKLAVWVEFVTLSDRTGDNHTAFHTLRAMQAVLKAPRRNENLVRMMALSVGAGLSGAKVTMEALGDFFLEWMIEESIGSVLHKMKMVGVKEMEGVDKMESFLSLSHSSPDGYSYMSSWSWEHLSCFVSGNLVFGGYDLNNYTISDAPGQTVTAKTQAGVSHTAVPAPQG
jgi:uncharacterized protein YneF (UPF0154 family)